MTRCLRAVGILRAADRPACSRCSGPQRSTGCECSVLAADLVLRGGRIITLDDVDARGAGARRARGRDRRDRIDGGRRRLHRLVDAGHRPRRAVRDARLHRRARPFHRHRRRQDGPRPARHEELGARSCDDGRGRRWRRRSRGSGSSAAAGIRRNGRRRRSRTSEGFRRTQSLDKVSPNNPVILTHASGHASFANAKAMELSGITAAHGEPDGGEILKDTNGEPTGLLRETASQPRPTRRRRAGAHAGRGRGARAAGARAGRSGSDLQGHHELSGRRHDVRGRSIA